ncbi:hypothetical protein [Diplocloster hominis]|uniref:hypothetical protein n=1 Tax=Diplocloster hominis TaxID=3079010 RepID=UPI0031BADCE8
MSNQIRTDQNDMNMEMLKEGVCHRIHEFLVKDSKDGNPEDLKNKMAEDFRIMLRLALRECGGGNTQAKNLIREFIRKILLDDYQIRTDAIDKLILFHDPEHLTVLDRFEILLYQYRLEFAADGLEKLLCRCTPKRHEQQGKSIWDISTQDINDVFFRERMSLDYLDKLQILTQRIFEECLGCGHVDLLCDMQISGLMAGKVPGEERISVWVDIGDRTFQLTFLQLNEEELKSICRRIQKSMEDEGERHRKKLPDNRRITVSGPPTAEEWMFFFHRPDNFLSEK